MRFIVELEACKPTAQFGKTLLVLVALSCSFDVAAPEDGQTGGGLMTPVGIWWSDRVVGQLTQDKYGEPDFAYSQE